MTRLAPWPVALAAALALAAPVAARAADSSLDALAGPPSSRFT